MHFALINQRTFSITGRGMAFILQTDIGPVQEVYAVEIHPEGYAFAAPVTVTFTWQDTDGDGLVDETDLPEAGLLVSKDGAVITPPCSENPECDPQANQVSVQVETLSLFALAALVNMPPAAGTVSAPVDPVRVGMPVSVSAPASDPNVGDRIDAVWEWGNGSTSPESVAGSTAFGEHIYAAPGVYTMRLVLRDETRYQKGASIPSGNTEFRFHAAGFEFRSSEYQWLVVAGTKAQFKGTGTVNGAGSYGFMVTALDERAKSGPDSFRLKVWRIDTGEVVYDSGETVLGGGEIAIHS